jgi:hypothetical protein
MLALESPSVAGMEQLGLSVRNSQPKGIISLIAECGRRAPGDRPTAAEVVRRLEALMTHGSEGGTSETEGAGNSPVETLSPRNSTSTPRWVRSHAGWR